MASLFTQPAAAYAKVAVERAVDRYPDGLTYAVPAELRDVRPGDRIVVPLGRGDKATPGYIVDIAASTALDPDRIKPIIGRDASGTRLPEGLVRLALWMSGYYAAPIGMTLAGMLPAAVKRRVGAVSRSMIDLAESATPRKKISPKQQAVLDVLSGLPPARRPIEISALADAADLRTTGPIKRLLEQGLLTVSARTSIEASWADEATDVHLAHTLTPDQTTVFEGIRGVLDAGFSSHLIHGVTGSGKTEVYIRLLSEVVDRGQVGIMLVPEIALTPQTGGRLIGRFPNHRVAILHSGLTAAQRHQQWALVSSGEANIILGARSGVFAPIEDDRIGLIIVDEEHDSSYKQDQVPRYHGRDVAVRRAHLAGCPIVLGSATPSMESWHNATVRGTYTLHRMPSRVPGARLPRVVVVDFAEERRRRRDRRVHLIGPILEERIDETLRQGGQVLLLLNRRGFANYIACPDHMCGWTMTCDHCDVTMVYHRNRELPTGGFVQCHHCLAEQKLPETCPTCGNRIVTFGLGTQRVEEELREKFDQLTETTLARVDSDTMRHARAFHDLLGRFGRGEIRLMVGTQMIAKGLDFPGVRLVGIVNADTALSLPDFRASERTFQLVSQMAGRSGRARDPGLVIVQSFDPETPAIQHAAAHDYEGFARMELQQREMADLPPFTRLARLVIRDEDLPRCIERATILADALTPLCDPSTRLRGPFAPPIARIAGRHRQQIEILAPTASVMQSLLARARSQSLIHADASLIVDVDPVGMT